MVTFIKFFIAYWIIGLFVVLFSLANDEVKKGFKDDTLAYILAAFAVSLLYPLAIVRKFLKNERSKKDESNTNV